MKTLLKFRKNYYSQNGEDGVIEEILKRLGIENGWFVDCGAWDGKQFSNTFFLLEKGWRGVDIEGDRKKYDDLLKTAAEFPNRLFTICANVNLKGDNLLDSLLSNTLVPTDFELLNIDIDSYDWWVWKTVKNYSPKIIIIEIDSSIPPGIRYVQPPGLTGLPGFSSGASFTSTLLLGKQKGYELVCHTGNLIFVRKDLIAKLNLPYEELKIPQSLFVEDWLIGKTLIFAKAHFLFALLISNIKTKFAKNIPFALKIYHLFGIKPFMKRLKAYINKRR